MQNVLDTRNPSPWTALDDGTGGRFVEQRLMPNARGWSRVADDARPAWAASPRSDAYAAELGYAQ